MSKEQLMEILRLCGADMSALEAVELAYQVGYNDGLDAALDMTNETLQ